MCKLANLPNVTSCERERHWAQYGNTQIFTFRTITELAKKMKKPIFISYVDLEKAFDKVNRNTMFKVLSDLGIGARMLEALKKLNSST